jgi:hypothetical protein
VTRVVFALSIAMSATSWIVPPKLYGWPWLQHKSREDALVTLIAPHMC